MTALAVGTSFNFALANTTVQERAPGPIRGRVSALAMMSFVGVMPFSAMLMGKLVDFTSIRVAMVTGAAGYAVASFFIFAGPGRYCGEAPPAVPVAAMPIPVEVEA